MQSPSEKTPETDEGATGADVLPRIRTYRGDASDTVKSRNLSAASIAIAEHEKRTRAEEKTAESGRKRRFSVKFFLIAVASAILILGGTALILYTLVIKKPDPDIANYVQDPVMRPLIFRDGVARADLSRAGRGAALGIVRDEVSRVGLPLNSVAHLFFTEDVGALAPDERVINAGRFLQILEAKAPGTLSRALRDTFFFGVHVFDGNQPFIIFETNSFEASFGGMLAWENDMSFDLAPLFVREGVAPVTDRAFRDGIIHNKDARILYDKNGKMVFFYSFLDRETLVFANNEHTFREIVERKTRLRVQ